MLIVFGFGFELGWGYVGTKEHAAGRDYVYGVVQGLQKECDEVDGVSRFFSSVELASFDSKESG